MLHKTVENHQYGYHLIGNIDGKQIYHFFDLEMLFPGIMTSFPVKIRELAYIEKLHEKY